MSVALVSVTVGQEDALNNARIKLVATWRKLMDKQHIRTNEVLRQKEDHAEKEQCEEFDPLRIEDDIQLVKQGVRGESIQNYFGDIHKKEKV